MSGGLVTGAVLLAGYGLDNYGAVICIHWMRLWPQSPVSTSQTDGFAWWGCESLAHTVSAKARLHIPLPWGAASQQWPSGTDHATYKCMKMLIGEKWRYFTSVTTPKVNVWSNMKPWPWLWSLLVRLLSHNTMSCSLKIRHIDLSWISLLNYQLTFYKTMVW